MASAAHVAGDFCAKSIPEYQQDAEYVGEDIIPGDGAIHAISRRAAVPTAGAVPSRDAFLPSIF